MEYYIYAYLREDGTPYYIGKGKGSRAWNKVSHFCKPPINKKQIIIMERNLTQIGAFALERFYIRWYGRKDLGTGVLRNLTDGGEGRSGYKHTDDFKNRMKIVIRKPKSESAKENMRRNHADVRGSKNPNYGKPGVKLLGKNNPLYGKTHSEESKKRMSEASKSYWKERHGQEIRQ